MFGLRPRETAGPTLGTELAKLEEQARTRLETAPAKYSRALLAASYGADGWTAQQTGTISQSSETVAATTVSHGATTDKLPSGVGAFAWQPTH